MFNGFLLEVAPVPMVLMTGPLHRMADMALALESVGFEVLQAPTDLGDVPPGFTRVDCYLQLPLDVPAPTGEGALGVARATVARSLLARFDAAAQVAPMLAPGAKVVLVDDSPAEGRPATDLRLARVLVEAILADHGCDHVRTAVVNGVVPREEIAAFAWSEPLPWTAYATMEPHLGFGDWRSQVICLRESHDW